MKDVCPTLCVLAEMLLLLIDLANADLSVFHVRVQDGQGDNSVHRQIVEDVAVLNLVPPGPTNFNHFFQCMTNIGNVDDLVWEKDGQVVRFKQKISTNARKMDMSSPLVESEGPLKSADAGLYTCRDTATMDSKSIQIWAEAVALIPAQPRYAVTLGGNVSLVVHVASYPNITSDDLQWFYGLRETAVLPDNDDRRELLNGNTTLQINSVMIGDSATYQVRFHKEIAGVVVNLTTSIELVVQVLPTVVVEPGVEQVKEHDPMMLVCVFVGVPEPTILWEREDNESLPLSFRHYITTSISVNDSVTLYTVRSEFIIFNVLLKDQGKFRCSASNFLTSSSIKSAYGQLKITPRLRLSSKVNRQQVDPYLTGGLLSVQELAHVVLLCNGSGSLTWSRSSSLDIPLINTITTPSVNLYQQNDFTLNTQKLFIQTFSSTSNRDQYICSTIVDSLQETISESVFITSTIPDVYIADEVVYTSPGSNAEMTAVYSSSSSSASSIIWYFQGNLITSSTSNTSGTPYYTLSSEVPGKSTLHVHCVSRAAVGEYTALVVVDGEHSQQSDSLQLLFYAPPSISTMPGSVTVLEGEEVMLLCEVEGLVDTLLWSLHGQGLLPSGVEQRGSSLVILAASRTHTGLYVCTAANSNGVDNSSMLLTVHYAPTVVVHYLSSVLTSTDDKEALYVETDEGQSVPSFICTADGVPTPMLTWTRERSHDMLLDVVVLTSTSAQSEQVLGWTRTLQYADSGRYVCTARNIRNSSRVVVELLVRRTSTITSIFPVSPVTSSFSSSSVSFHVPAGHKGPVLTCTATGWPAPTLEWRREGKVISISSLTVSSGDNSVYSTLQYNAAFQESDAGIYTCAVLENDTQLTISSQSVRLKSSLEATAITTTAVHCKVDGSVVYFQIRVLETDCQRWMQETGKSQLLATEFMNALISVLEASCEGCGSVEVGEVLLTDGPTCSKQLPRATVFNGAVNTGGVGRTEKIFCGLSRWQQSGPFLVLDNRLHLLDQTCVLETERDGYTVAGECSASRSTFSLVFIFGLVLAGAFLLLVVFIIGCWINSLRTRTRMKILTQSSSIQSTPEKASA